MDFEIGDTVTRDGTDEQEVIWVSEDCHSIEVRCTKEPMSGWCKEGEIESNLARRYALVFKNIKAETNRVRVNK